MNFAQRAITITCRDECLVGVLAVPETPVSAGVLVIVGGPQYRVGSHRQFLLLSWRLAAAGIPVLRFDYRGMGDSSGSAIGFERVDDDIAAAIDAFQAAIPQLREIVLWGLCDAASAALMYAPHDRRVHSLALLNPWVRSQAGYAKTQIKHYYRARLLDRRLWSKVLAGKFRFGDSLRSLGGSLRSACSWRKRQAMAGPLTFQMRMARALRRFQGPVLLLISGRDLTAKEFLDLAVSDPTWAGLMDGPRVALHVIADADHTFSGQRWRNEAETLTLDWLAAAGLMRSAR